MSRFIILETSRPLPQRAGLLDADIILCRLPENAATPFVTWQRNIEENARYWGHYHADEAEARAEFAERCKKAGV